MNRHEPVREQLRVRRMFAAPLALSFALHASALVLCTTLHWGSASRGAATGGDGDGDAFTLRLGRATVLAAASRAADTAQMQNETLAKEPEVHIEIIAEPVHAIETAPFVAPAVAADFVRAPELATPPANEPALATERTASDATAADVAAAGAGALAHETSQAVGAESAATSATTANATASALAPATSAHAESDSPTNAAGASALGAAQSTSAPPGSAASTAGSGGADHGPRVIVGPRPVYPHESEMRGEYGKVLCSVFVDARGAVEKVEVVRSSGYARLDRAAVAGLSRWRFEPAVERGTPVASLFRHTVSFVFE